MHVTNIFHIYILNTADRIVTYNYTIPSVARDEISNFAQRASIKIYSGSGVYQNFCLYTICTYCRSRRESPYFSAKEKVKNSMIIYEKGGFDGPAKLFRIHGSAVYKSILPAMLSTIISFMYDYAEFAGMYNVHPSDEFYTVVRHPYTITAFIAIFRYDAEELSIVPLNFFSFLS